MEMARFNAAVALYMEGKAESIKAGLRVLIWSYFVWL